MTHQLAPVNSDAPALTTDQLAELLEMPDGACLAIKLVTRGRPCLIRHEDGQPKLLDSDATRADIYRLVGYQSGTVRMIPATEDGIIIDPKKYWEIDLSPEEVGEQQSENFYARMFERLLENYEEAQRQQRDTMDMVRELIRSQNEAMIDQHRAGADLLRAANESVKVANGIDVLERQLPAPQVDIKALSELLAEHFGEESQGDDSGWFAQFLKSPLLPVVAGLANGFAQPIIQMHQARMQAEIAAVQAETTEEGTD